MININMYTCNTCEKSFPTKLGRGAHQKVHSPRYEQHKRKNIQNTLKTNAAKKANRIKRYLENPADCKQCGKVFKYEARDNKFCGRSCAATYNNLNAPTTRKRGPHKGYGAKFRPLILNAKSNKNTRINGAACRIYTCRCAHCGIQFVNRRAVKYCCEHTNLYKSNNRNRYRFTFRIDQHPVLFGKAIIDKIRKYGFWSPTNTNGLTRDHCVSVNEAIRNNYDPYYITHPVNCEIMKWDANNRKNTKCSIAYEQLVREVDEYDKIYSARTG